MYGKTVFLKYIDGSNIEEQVFAHDFPEVLKKGDRFFVRRSEGDYTEVAGYEIPNILPWREDEPRLKIGPYIYLRAQWIYKVLMEIKNGKGSTDEMIKATGKLSFEPLDSLERQGLLS